MPYVQLRTMLKRGSRSGKIMGKVKQEIEEPGKRNIKKGALLTKISQKMISIYMNPVLLCYSALNQPAVPLVSSFLQRQVYFFWIKHLQTFSLVKQPLTMSFLQKIDLLTEIFELYLFLPSLFILAISGPIIEFLIWFVLLELSDQTSPLTWVWKPNQL